MQDETIAGLQRANEKLRRERDAALAREAALAEVLNVINRSPGDPGPVFEAILEKAHRLCGADAGALMRYDGEHFHAVATHGLPDEFAAMVRRPFRGASHQRLIDGERIVHVADAKAIPALRELGEVERAFVDHTNLRTSLFVPLRKDDALLGFISADRHEVRPFSDTEILLLESFADQAVIAIENTRLLAEQQEALEQQTATAEVLQVINASPGNLAPVFDVILEKARRLCEADMGTFWTFEGDYFYPIGISQGSPLNPEVREKHMGWRPSPNVSLGRVMAGENVVHIVDVTADAGYQSDPIALDRTSAAGTRSALTVALRSERGLLGAITTTRQTVRPYSDKQITLLQNFAAQAVIAMENARLITEQREALEQQTATGEVLQVINASPGDLAPVFEAILEKAHTLCGAIIGSLSTYDGEYMRVAAAHGYPRDYDATFLPPVRPSRAASQRLIDGDRFVHVPDMQELQPRPEGNFGRMIERTGLRTALMIPLRKDGAFIGQISAFRPEVRAFSDKEIALLESFAAQAVIAMENARLLTEQQEALEQQTATAEVLQVINASPGDLAPVFDAMLEKAMRLCEARLGAFFKYDGTFMHLAASRGAPPEAVEAFRQWIPQPGAMGYAIVQGAHTVHVADVTDTEAFRAGVVTVRKMVETTQIRTGLWIGLRRDDALVGLFRAL